jgi:hypothetical protein
MVKVHAGVHDPDQDARSGPAGEVRRNDLADLVRSHVDRALVEQELAYARGVETVDARQGGQEAHSAHRASNGGEAADMRVHLDAWKLERSLRNVPFDDQIDERLVTGTTREDASG